ncbi:MAG: hypothetical protein WBQ73_00580 [Candidatus Babeliales bacterium]
MKFIIQSLYCIVFNMLLTLSCFSFPIKTGVINAIVGRCIQKNLHVNQLFTRSKVHPRYSIDSAISINPTSLFPKSLLPRHPLSNPQGHLLFKRTPRIIIPTVHETTKYKLQLPKCVTAALGYCVMKTIQYTLAGSMMIFYSTILPK